MFTINLVYCQTFLVVCSLGNFTEAAKHLYVPQPTITNRIRYLEEELGQELFVRKNGKRTAELTKSGKKFQAYAQQVIQDFNAMKIELNQENSKDFISIGSTISLTHPLLFEKINSLYEADKHNINLLQMDHSQVQHSLLEGTIDLAFVTEHIIDEQLESHIIFREKFGITVSCSHPLAKKKRLDHVQDLKNEFLIFYKPLTKCIMQVHLIDCKKRVVTNEIKLVNYMIRNHNAVALLPQNVFNFEGNDSTQVHIPIHDERLDCEIEYYLVTRKNERYDEDIFFNHLDHVTAKAL